MEIVRDNSIDGIWKAKHWISGQFTFLAVEAVLPVWIL